MATMSPAPPAIHKAARMREVDEFKTDREQGWGSRGLYAGQAVHSEVSQEQ